MGNVDFDIKIGRNYYALALLVYLLEGWIAGRKKKHC